jgi:uncharacterized protein (TIGR02270 family)
MAMRRIELSSAIAFLKELLAAPGGLRAGLRGAASLGAPEVIPLVLERLDDPEGARAVCSVLHAITGLDVRAQKMSTKAPDAVEARPNDDSDDDDADIDPDEGLPWPQPTAVRAWWTARSLRYQSGTRYLLGEPITPSTCHAALRAGKQPARASAAIELSLRDRSTPLFDVNAPAHRQKRALGIR